MKARIGVVGIVIENRTKIAGKINDILSNYGEIIIGRMGIPAREYGISVISLIVKGSSDQIGAMTGQLGNLPGVTLKSALTKKEVE